MTRIYRVTDALLYIESSRGIQCCKGYARKCILQRCGDDDIQRMANRWSWPFFVSLYSIVFLQSATGSASDWPVPTTTISYTSATHISDVSSDCDCSEISASVIICEGPRTCKRFPNFHIEHDILNVERTAINTIYIGDLSNLGHLRSLSINSNTKLTLIEAGVFSGMDFLENLSISFNSKLSYLENGTFKGLYNLTKLELINNNFHDIESISYSLSPNYLPRLLNLTLNQNTFKRISSHSFLPLIGTSLIELQLKLCELEFIHHEALRPLKKLRNLHLDQNALNETTLTNLINQTTQDNLTILSMDLGYLGFHRTPKELLSIIGQSSIISLNLDGNQFSSLARGSFPFMPGLQYLSLKYCKIKFVHNGTFDFTVLPNLRSLSLANNQLTRVSPGVLPSQISELDLSRNSFNRLQPINFFLGEGNFVHMTNLTILNISYASIEIITNKTFAGLGNLWDHLGLKNASISRIEPGSFRELVNLTFLNLDNNPFPTLMELTADIFEGLDSLEVLLLSGCGINNFRDPDVFSPLKKLEYLMLDDNQIVRLDPRILYPLPSLIGLSLERNNIEPWTDVPLFQYNNNVSILFLANNKLTFISAVMLEDFSKLQTVQLSNNIFICDCFALQQARQWNNISMFNFSSGSVPYCEAPEHWKNREWLTFIHSAVYEDICPAEVSFVWLEVLLSIFVLLTVALGIASYKYRSYIRYWLFLARMDLRRRGLSRYRGRRKKTCKGYTNYQYDAFVSYSNEDRNFVVRLVAMLENYEPFLKLCVYERDFEIGTVISEAVLESVAMSRRTLLIVSDAFAKSQWCMWELRLAEHHRLFFEDDSSNIRGQRDDTLIMVKLGNVRTSNMTPTLKYLMKTRVYLEWDQDPRKQRLFWEKLRATLAPPNVSIKTSK